MSKHGETERSIIRLFEEAKEFIFQEEKYEIINIGKPRPSKGECKTDIYILTTNLSTRLNKEFKISIKQGDADFLGNKLSIERATEIFGRQASHLIKESIKSVENDFLEDYLVYFKKAKRTEAKCLKIGWKFEFINKPGGKRVAKLSLSDSQKIDIYAGTNLSNEKKNSKVNGEIIENSGIANYILTVDNTDEGLEYYLDRLFPIEEFAVKQDIYFACKAINFRVEKDKWDSNRPLSVFINWSLENNVLKAEFVMDRPLEFKANEIGENIRDILVQLKINSTNFDDLKNYLDDNVNYID